MEKLQLMWQLTLTEKQQPQMLNQQLPEQYLSAVQQLQKRKHLENHQLTKGSKRLTVTFNKMKNSGKVFYEIQYSTKKNFKKATKTLKVSAKKTKVIIKKLRGNKKYYVRIRAYQTKKINGKNKKVYSVWTKVKAVKTKK